MARVDPSSPPSDRARRKPRHSLPDAKERLPIILGTEAWLLNGVNIFAANMLRRLHYLVVDTADAGEALALLRDGMQPELLLTDVVLPGGMSGRVLVNEARELVPGIRILHMSGHTENVVVHQGRFGAKNSRQIGRKANRNY